MTKKHTCKNCDKKTILPKVDPKVEKEIEQARLDLVTERIVAAEDFRILTLQLKEQYISMRIAPYQKVYQSLLEKYDRM